MGGFQSQPQVTVVWIGDRTTDGKPIGFGAETNYTTNTVSHGKYDESGHRIGVWEIKSRDLRHLEGGQNLPSELMYINTYNDKGDLIKVIKYQNCVGGMIVFNDGEPVASADLRRSIR